MEFSILNILLVLLVAWLAGLLSARLGYPSVLGELLAGIVLGPALLGFLQPSEALNILAETGILVMMLYIGMEIDPKELGRASKGGLLAALGGFITPFVLCYLAIIWAGGTVLAAIFVGVAAGVTSLATKSRILVDLQLLDTRIAHVLMAGALIADTISLVIFAGIIGVAEAGTVEAGALTAVALKALAFFALAVLIGLKVFPLLGRVLKTTKLLNRTSTFMFIIIIALGYAELAELAGMHGILGSFLAGLFLRESILGRSLSKEVMHLVRDVSIGFLAPIFFVTAGFAVTLDVFSTSLGLLLLIVFLATAGKIVGTALFYIPTGNGWREGVTIGAGMNGRGAVEIIIAQIGLTMGLITQEIFSILVVMAIATTATVPVFLKLGTDWLRRRGELQRSDQDRSGVLIVGAGPTARALGRILNRSQDVWIVDRNKEHCALAEADGLNVVNGNALEEEVLAEAQAAHVRHFIALTPNTEVNTLVSRLARTVFFVPDVHILSDRDTEGHAALTAYLHANTAFGGQVPLEEWDYRIDHEQYEHTGLATEHVEVPSALYQQLQQHRPTLPLAIRRGDTYLPFHSGLTLADDDRVIVFQEEAMQAEADRFDQLVSKAPVLDIESDVEMGSFFEMAAGALAPRLNTDPVELAALLMHRESVGSTVLLPGLAIPHVILDGEGEFEVLLARAREGIQFTLSDASERVHAAFVLVGTQDERTFHLRALSAIAQIVQNTDFEQQWLTATDAEALRRLILKANRRRIVDRLQVKG